MKACENNILDPSWWQKLAHPQDINILAWNSKALFLCCFCVQQSCKAQLPYLSGFQLGKTPIPEAVVATCHWACSLTDMRRFHMFHMFHLCQNWGPISPINHNDVPLVLYISLTEKGPYPQQLEIVILKSERLVFYLHASHAATKHCTSAPVISKSVAAIAARRKQSSNATAFWKRLHTTSTASQRRQAEESSLEDKENTLGDLSALGSRNSASYRQRKFAPRLYLYTATTTTTTTTKERPSNICPCPRLLHFIPSYTSGPGS